MDKFFKYLPIIASVSVVILGGLNFVRERKMAALAQEEHGLKKELLGLQISSLKQNLPA